MTGGIEVPKGRKNSLSFHDLDGLSADEKFWPFYDVRLTDRLAACGFESVRGNGFCQILFR